MTPSTRYLALRMTLAAMAALPLAGAAYKSCDGSAIRPKMSPIVLRPNGCSFKDLSDPTGRALGILAREGAVWWKTIVPPPVTSDPCVMHHDDGTWDVALVDRGTIDGLAGSTMKLYDGCPDSHIYESDIMLAVDLNFEEGDQRHQISSPSAAGAGRIAALHEYGHALGLEHSDAEFAVMRGNLALGAGMGGATNTGSPHYFFADDAFGLLQIGGIPRRVPNFYVTAQVVLPGGSLRDADVNNDTGIRYSDPLPVRTRQPLTFLVGAGIHEWWSRDVVLRAYADSSATCTPLPDVGVTLGVAVVSMTQFNTAVGLFAVLVPPLGPSGQVLNVHVAGTVMPSPFAGEETRGWDDCATTGLRLLTP